MSVFPPTSPSVTPHRQSHTIGFGHAKSYNPSSSSMMNNGQFGFGQAFSPTPSSSNPTYHMSGTSTSASGGWRTPFASIGNRSATTLGWGGQGNLGGGGQGSTKRRRSPSPGFGRMESSPIPEEKEKRVIKRGRVVKDAVSTPIGSQTAKKEDVDLGKALADLDAPALRSLVLSLASSNPSLIPSIQSLLPQPTLESLLHSLSSVESPLVNSIPRGTARPEYILGRVRGPLQEWIAEVGRVCSIGESWTRTEAGKEEEHPNTVFTLFLTASLSFIRVHAALPIDNVREILPALQRGWKAWLAMVQRRLGEGKLVSESTGREWLRKLEELGEGGREVRDDVERIVGPFIGLRRPVGMDMEEL